MRFTLGHSRAVMGQDISVAVEGGEGQIVRLVETDLDGFTLGQDTLDLPSVSYEREFRQAGDAAPGMDHKLTVVASDDQGRQERATRIWTDDI